MTQTTFDAHPRSSLIVALDFDSLSSAVKFATQVADLVGMFKIGNQLFTAAGPAAAKEVGVDGVVASVQEAKAIRKACGEGFLIITPGVRPKDSEVQQAPDDQSRKASPREAIRAGADFLVVGRPILAAADPRVAAQAIVDEIAAAK